MTFEVPETKLIDIEALKQNIQAYVNLVLSYPTVLKKDKETAEEYTDKMLERFAGCWHGDESTDQIMSQIKEGRTVREPLFM